MTFPSDVRRFRGVELDTKAYLDRINYQGSLTPTAQTLRDLQVAHLLAVPFENLSIHARQPIVLEDEALFTKIVQQRRGGFCYETNGLFAALLRDLGFSVTMLSAQVFQTESFGPDFDHMVLMAHLEQRWLVDVGFGDSFREPLRIDGRDEQQQGSRTYQILSDPPYLVLMQRKANEEWQAQYRFTLQPHDYTDYAEMCRYHQTSPDSPFTKARVCSRATERGRLTLDEKRLITTSEAGTRQEKVIANPADYAELLHQHFGIVMMN